ncbi:MAG: hypothetical protein IPL23_19090 [Saprospiraceae bacterium]|nr:hypothetical protein [Saprospiraceae bacterium]MBK8636074.1 hypothetical protein [Saprospiraceae bacterium]MBP7643356.1 hypothetical protein [Saprospiraceae bacterium]
MRKKQLAPPAISCYARSNGLRPQSFALSKSMWAIWQLAAPAIPCLGKKQWSATAILCSWQGHMVMGNRQLALPTISASEQEHVISPIAEN